MLKEFIKTLKREKVQRRKVKEVNIIKKDNII
jgi:hypothetical protein